MQEKKYQRLKARRLQKINEDIEFFFPGSTKI